MLKTMVFTFSGTPRQELLSFLYAMPALDIRDLPEKSGEVTDWIPDLVVLDAVGSAGWDCSLFCQLKTRIPHACYIVLVGSVQQMRSALDDGVDRAFLSGFSAAEFARALDELRT